MINNFIKDFKQSLDQIGISDWLEDWDFENINREVAKLLPGQLYVEVGVAFGVSASLALASSLKGVKVKGVDIINWDTRDRNIKEILIRHSRSPRLEDWEFIEGESEVVARYWPYGQIDLLFIDGDHDYEGVIRDIALWIPWLKHGGTVMFDDYNDKTGVIRAVNEVLRNHKAFKNHRIDNEMYLCTKI